MSCRGNKLNKTRTASVLVFNFIQTLVGQLGLIPGQASVKILPLFFLGTIHAELKIPDNILLFFYYLLKALFIIQFLTSFIYN